MSTIDNPETQTIKLQKIKEKKHFTDRRTNQIPEWEIPQDPRAPIIQNSFPKTPKNPKNHTFIEKRERDTKNKNSKKAQKLSGSLIKRKMLKF